MLTFRITWRREMAKDTSKAKSMVMQKLFKMRVVKDKSKFNKKEKHKGRILSDLSSLWAA
jgi:stalled ribosome alternative rescue factor ArfA